MNPGDRQGAGLGEALAEIAFRWARNGMTRSRQAKMALILKAL
jgi:hypothetical protein